MGASRGAHVPDPLLKRAPPTLLSGLSTTTSAQPRPTNGEEQAIITTRLVLREQRSHPYVWLEAEYNGRTPPDRLFDDLAMIGWTPPAPIPPPKSAIDWTVPDAERGTSFSIGDYEVTAEIAAPPGGGRRGSWTEGERAAFLQTLEGVLSHHGTSTRSELPPPPPLDAVEPATTAAVRPAPERPAPAAVAEPVPASMPRDTGDLRLTVVLRAYALAGAQEVLQGLRLRYEVGTIAQEKVENYRGSRSTKVVQVPCVRAVLDGAQCELVVGALVDAGVIVDEAAATVEAIEVATRLAAVAEPAADPVHATAVVVVSPLRTDALAELLAPLAAAGVRWSEASLVATTNHRGSVREVTRRAARADFSVAPAAIGPLMTELRHLGVDVDDLAQVRIELPRAPTEPAPVADLTETVDLDAAPDPPVPSAAAPASPFFRRLPARASVDQAAPAPH
jgi:hypothetical protein